ncbi:type 2 lantibiotic [Bacillus sp. WMMC1349]|uniref:lichenicidin A2 family type 2 lantibiotic n=1 Tax=Bacillus sp. WMMC1349 TaxID=2736254 RepID=UPI0015516521|nr:lichenicidin A2 family type 2 lantibiotic [Bacillus sp. WMMC1349]NPC93162.1 type 2 lantibiotic [Bacillus sp. WMMC1349]
MKSTSISDKKVYSAIGSSLRELSISEMEKIYGSSGSRGQVEPNSTPICSFLISGVGSYLGSAAFKCGKDNK